MGLLTDPSSEQGKLTKLLLKYHKPLCILLFVSGVLWFAALAYPTMNASTYFSENALLPGLVKSEFREDRLATQYHQELMDEITKHKNSIPYSWILAKFRQIGLDTYTHNFSLNFPLRRNEIFQGKNVYGIIRAARAASTEALVLSVPFRSGLNAQLSTAPSIAIMMAFANYANKKMYWAKDIIFLITEHEQLGVQAWLEAYHGVTCGEKNTLYHGDLKGRAGAIQAAINLELYDTKIDHIDIKIEGLNGQLPNLDLFNLAVKMCAKEGVHHTFKNRSTEYSRDLFKVWKNSIETLLSMIRTQTAGVPNGNHGLFHRFGIQALTLEGHPAKSKAVAANFLNIGRVLEGIFRSLNNLLERFHQSFFFYLLPSSERYISIGLYMPSVCLMAGALIVKACAKWCQLEENSQQENNKQKNKSSKPCSKYENIEKVICIWLIAHVFGVLIMISPVYLVQLGESYNLNITSSIFWGMVLLLCIQMILPWYIPKNCVNSMTFLHIFALLELGTVIICVAMNNFSLALCYAVVSIQALIFLDENNHPVTLFFNKIHLLLVHPLVLLFLNVAYTTTQIYLEETTFEKSFTATQQAIVFSIVDSMIYGNWLFNVVTSLFIPIWMCFWCVAFSDTYQQHTVKTSRVTNEKKTN